MAIRPELITIEDLRQQLSQVTEKPDESTGLPPACYADKSIFELEVKAVFHHTWVGIGREDRWKAAGDYSAMDIGGVPVIIIRNKASELKGFANTCRHRGSQILTGSGNCKKMRCPFHWWSYDLDGRLKVYPRMEKAVDFNPDDYGLVELRVACRDGFAFICLDPETEELDNWLGDFSDLHVPWEPSQLVSTRVREFDVNCNWKTFIEVFNEYYHLPYVHPESLNWLYPEPDDVDEVTGNYTTQFGPTDGKSGLMADTQDQALPAAKQLSGREALGTRYTWVYPNMTFAASQDSLWMYQAYPLAPGRSHIVQTICFPADTVRLDDFESRAQNYYARYDAALDEDIPFLEQQQVGVSSKFAKPGRFSSLEPSVAKFAHWYAGELGAALD